MRIYIYISYISTQIYIYISIICLYCIDLKGLALLMIIFELAIFKQFREAVGDSCSFWLSISHDFPLPYLSFCIQGLNLSLVLALKAELKANQN